MSLVFSMLAPRFLALNICARCGVITDGPAGNRNIIVAELGPLIAEIGNLLPTAEGQNYTPLQVKVPVTSTIPNINDPFASGTRNAASRTAYKNHPDNPDKTTNYLYAMYAPNIPDPKLFFQVDEVSVTDKYRSQSQFSASFMFDTKNDGYSWINLADDDFGLGMSVNPNDKPPTGHYFSRLSSNSNG
jgi:hypothetical protein